MSNTLLTGYYNRDFFQYNPLNDYTVIPAFIQEYPNNTTIMSGSSVRLPPCITAPDFDLFYETYTWVTYEDSTLQVKLGEITYDCLYPDSGSGNISAPSIQDMTVLGADGIYAGVKIVTMDFTQPPIRTIQFKY
jgi:hypothetical protein